MSEMSVAAAFDPGFVVVPGDSGLDTGSAADNDDDALDHDPAAAAVPP